MEAILEAGKPKFEAKSDPTIAERVFALRLGEGFIDGHLDLGEDRSVVEVLVDVGR